MSKATKILEKMKSNPKDDWTPANIKTVAKAFDLKIRQSGTSHAVLTNAKGQHITVPMHKPVKPYYIMQFVRLIERG